MKFKIGDEVRFELNGTEVVGKIVNTSTVPPPHYCVEVANCNVMWVYEEILTLVKEAFVFR